MPSPSETRKQRIEALVTWGLENNIDTIDLLLKAGSKLWPTVDPETRLSYAQNALQIIRKTLLPLHEPIPKPIDIVTEA